MTSTEHTSYTMLNNITHSYSLTIKLQTMRSVTRVFSLLLLLFITAVSQNTYGQSVLDPTDPIVDYNSAAPPTQPPTGQIGKWVRTPRLSWNTSRYKCYIYNGVAFRLLFPKTYNPTANDGKKYPMMVFFHGLGEAGSIYDNEFQLYHGGDYFVYSQDLGNYDGYIILMQSQGFWGGGHYAYMKNIIDYMVKYNKLDAFRVTDNGLSAGGAATWDMFLTYPSYIAAALPMSATAIYYKDAPTPDQVKFTPWWNIHGGLDDNPAPSTAEQVNQAMQAVGANYKDLLYPDLGHGTWDRVWNEPDFWPFMKRAYSSNPWPLFGRTEFCPNEAFTVTIGLATGFNVYQWRKDGVLIQGATTNSIQATQIGTYDARVCRVSSYGDSLWSDWSPVPVVIKTKAATMSPNIQVNGAASYVIPSLDGSTSVTLTAPAGYTSYLWQKEGNTTTLATTQTYTATSPGSYKVKVTEQFGCSSNFSNLFNVVDANGANKPDPAINLVATTLSKTSQRLDWSDNPTPQYNETNFEIYRALQTGGPYTFIGMSAQDVKTYTLTTLNPGIKYFYKVRAINNNGAAAASNEASATTLSDVTAPTTPMALTVLDVTKTSATIKWTASTDDVGVTKYEIYINGQKSYVTTNTQFLLSSLQTNTTYNVAIKAKDFAGNASAFSNQVTIVPSYGVNYKYYTYSGYWGGLPNFSTLTPQATGKMQNIYLTPRTQDDQFAFLWEGYIKITVAGTYYFKTASDDGSRLWLGALNGTSSPYNYNDPGIVNNDGAHGTQEIASGPVNLSVGVYPIAIAFFELTGDQVMNVSWKTPVPGATFVPIPNMVFTDQPAQGGVAPNKPSNLTATAVSYKRIDLSWTDNSTNETNFEIYRSVNMFTNFTAIGRAAAGATAYQDTTVAANTKYYYAIKAINSYGESDFDRPGQGVDYIYYQAANIGVMPTPAVMSAWTPSKTGRVTNFGIGMQDRSDQFQLKFTTTITVPAAAIYTFYVTSDDGSKLYIDGWDDAHLVVNNDGAHEAIEKSASKSLTAGSHTITLTYFELGSGESLSVAISAPGLPKQAIPDLYLGTPYASATSLTAPGAPVIPSTLIASGTTKSTVTVTWADRSTNETGFELYRSSGNNGNYIPYILLPANTTSFVDTGLFANAIYYYKVRATGNVSNSGFAAEDSAKTKNSIPVITQMSTRTARYDIVTNITLTASDSDGDALTFSSPNLPSFATLINNGDKTATLKLTPPIAQATYSNIKVLVKDPNGGADSTIFNLIVNSNYDPVINTITDYTINENDLLTIPLVATDQNATDVLTWSVANAPAGFVLTQNGTGTASLKVQPNYAAAGTYPIVVTVNDGHGGITTRQFNLFVVDKDPNLKVYIRIESTHPIGSPWNGITAQTTTNLKDYQNNTTSIGLNFPYSFHSGNQGATTNNNSGVYPDAVLQDYYLFGPSWIASSGGATLTGLDPAKKYNLTFFGSSVFNIAADNGSTGYTVNGQTVSLNVQNNTQNTVTINNLAPAADGTLAITMTQGTAAGYLNALIITSVYDDGTNPVAPTTLSAQYSFGQGVVLTWQDVAYNETAYEVYRSATSGGVYTLISTINTANTVTYTDNTATGNTQYYYKVRAINTHGASGYSNIATLTTPNRVPQIAAISNVVLKSNQSTTINISATDDASDHIRFSVSGLPPFAALVDNGNGTGTITITPNAGSVGVYSGIVVTAKDNSDSSRSTSFDISIVDKDMSSVYLNFSDGTTAGKPWNNLINPQFAGAVFNGLKDDGDNTTAVTVTMQDGFEWTQGSGMRPRNGKEIYPEVVMRNGVIESSTTAKRIVVSGLDITKKYNFVFFNSRDNGNSGVTNFTIGTQTVTLNGSYNSTKTVQINGITTSTGSITISVSKATGSDYAFLNAMVIQSYVPNAVAILSPTNLRVTSAQRNSISLQWQDRSDNEATTGGFEIWRATDGTSTYTQVGSVNANVTTFTDNSVAANKGYYYIVRAKKNSTTWSVYSNVANANSYAYSVYVNFNSVNPVAAPWNNLNTIPQVGYVWNNFNDETSLPTSLGMVETGLWAGMYGAGMNTGNNSGVYSDTVMAESYGLFPGQSATLKITGLNLAMKYDFTFFASSTDGRDVTVAYTVNGQTSLLNASLNKSGTLTMYNITADENGEVLITVAPGTPTSQFGLIGALVMQGYSPSTGSVPLPATERVGREPLVETIAATASAKPVAPSELTAYPNPFDQFFTLAVPVKGTAQVQVDLYDLSGQLLYRNQFGSLADGTNYLKIQPAQSIKPGLYMVRVTAGNSKQYQLVKVIKR